MIAKLAADSPSVPIDFHKTVYGYGSEGSLVRQLVVNVAVQNWKSEWSSKIDALEDAAEEFRDDLLYALARKLKDVGGPGDPVREVGCWYHEHRAAGTPCYKKMF